MERSNQLNPNFGFVQNAGGVQFGTSTGVNPRQSLPPPPPLVRHGLATSSNATTTPVSAVPTTCTVGNGGFSQSNAGYTFPNVATSAATHGNSWREPTDNAMRFPRGGARLPGAMTRATGAIERVPGSSPRIPDTIPGNHGERHTLRQQLQHEYNITNLQQMNQAKYPPPMYQQMNNQGRGQFPCATDQGQGAFPSTGLGQGHVPGVAGHGQFLDVAGHGFQYGGLTNQMNVPRMDVPFTGTCRMPGNPNQNIPSNLRQSGQTAVPISSYAENRQSPGYGLNQFPINQGQRMPPVAHQNLPRMPPTAHHSQKHNLFSPGRSSSSNTSTSQGHGQFGIGSGQGHVGMIAVQSGHVSQAQSNPGLGSVQRGNIFQGQGHVGMGSVQEHNSFQGRSTSTQMVGSVNSQSVPSRLQQQGGSIAPDRFVNIADAAASLGLLSASSNTGVSQPSNARVSQPSNARVSQPSNARVSQPSNARVSQPSQPTNFQGTDEEKYRFLRQKLETFGGLQPDESVQEYLARYAMRETRRRMEHSPKTIPQQQIPVDNSNSLDQRLHSETNAHAAIDQEASKILSAFALRPSQEAHDKEVLGRWYAPPTTQTDTPEAIPRSVNNCSPQSITNILGENVTIPTVAVTSNTTSNSCSQPATVVSETFMPRPNSVVDVEPRARSQHTSSVDTVTNSGELANESNQSTSTMNEASADNNSPKVPANSSSTGVSQNGSTAVMTRVHPVQSSTGSNVEVTQNVSTTNVTQHNPVLPTSSGEFADDSAEQSGLVLDMNKQRLVDELVLNSQYCSQDMNPEIDFSTYLPSPGLPADFSFPPSMPTNDSDVNVLQSASTVQIDTRVETVSVPAVEFDIDESTIESRQKRKRGSISEDSPPSKRKRGCGRGRGRGRGRGNQATRRARGRMWAVNLTPGIDRAKAVPTRRKQTARMSRGRGLGSRGRGKHEPAMEPAVTKVEDALELAESASNVTSLDGQVIQNPQELKDLMDRLPDEELETTTVSLSTLAMMLAWSKVNANAGPEDIDQESDIVSVGSVGDAAHDADIETVDAEKQQDVTSEVNNKEHNTYEPPVDVMEAEQNQSSEILKNSDTGTTKSITVEYQNMKPLEVKSPAKTLSDIDMDAEIQQDATSEVSNKEHNTYEPPVDVIEAEESQSSETIKNADACTTNVETVEYGDMKSLELKSPVETLGDKNIFDNVDEESERYSRGNHHANEELAEINNLEKINAGNEHEEKVVENNEVTKYGIKNNDFQSETNVSSEPHVNTRVPTQVYPVSSTHKMTWVRYHGRTVTHLITPDGNFFIMKEILRRCFRIQEPNKSLKFNKIGILKRKVLNIPDIKLESVFHDYVVKNLVERKVIRTVPDQFIIISEFDANRLFHYVCKEQYCGDACVTPFYQNQTSSMAPVESDNVAKVSTSLNDSEAAGCSGAIDTATKSSKDFHTSPTKMVVKKDRNLFDFMENETSLPKIDNTLDKIAPRRKRHRHPANEVINLCSDDEESNGYDSDKTLPYIDGHATSFDKIRDLDDSAVSSKAEDGQKIMCEDIKSKSCDISVAESDKTQDNEVTLTDTSSECLVIKSNESTPSKLVMDMDCVTEDSNMQQTISLANSPHIEISVASEEVNKLVEGESQIDSAKQTNFLDKKTENEFQTADNSDSLRRKHDIHDSDIIIINDDEEDQGKTTFSDTSDSGICKLTLDHQLKNKFSVQSNVNSSVNVEPVKLVQVHNIDSTEVSVSGTKDDVQSIEPGISGKNLVNRFGNSEKVSDKEQNKEVTDEVQDKYRRREMNIDKCAINKEDISITSLSGLDKNCSGTDDDNVPMSDCMELDLTIDDSDVTIGEWVFPAPPVCYPDDGTKKLDEAHETLQKIIEKANRADKTEDFVDVLDNVLRLTGPLKQWTNTLFDHYEEGILIEAERLKSLDQLKLKDISNIVELDDDDGMDVPRDRTTHGTN